MCVTFRDWQKDYEESWNRIKPKHKYGWWIPEDILETWNKGSCLQTWRLYEIGLLLFSALDFLVSHRDSPSTLLFYRFSLLWFSQKKPFLFSFTFFPSPSFDQRSQLISTRESWTKGSWEGSSALARSTIMGRNHPHDRRSHSERGRSWRARFLAPREREIGEREIERHWRKGKIRRL